jgi:hypothetical protein
MNGEQGGTRTERTKAGLRCARELSWARSVALHEPQGALFIPRLCGGLVTVR